jgi:hypothetical protein
MFKTAALSLVTLFTAKAAAVSVDQSTFKNEIDVKVEVKGFPVTLYEHGHYTGASLKLSGVKIEQSVKRDINWDNIVSSYKIADGVKVRFCKDRICENETNNENMIEAFGPLEVNWVGNKND